jgi:hypothetical protein
LNNFVPNMNLCFLLWLFFAEAEQQQQQQPSSSGVQALKQNVKQTAAAGKGRQKPKLPGFPGGAAGAAAAAAALAAAKQQRQQGLYDDEYEDEEEATPEFQLVFDNGKAVSEVGLVLWLLFGKTVLCPVSCFA